jgi:DNA-binding response OmpR family regulator
MLSDHVGKRRLLLVDADARSVRVMERTLSKAGHDVAAAADGEEALATVEWWRPDLVLTETNLAKVDGRELVLRLKDRPDGTDICCAFLTRDRSIEQRIRGLEVGIDDYITKPIFAGDLVSRVNLLLARRRRDGDAPPTQGPSFPGATDATILDLLKSLEVSGRSGIVRVNSRGLEARIYIRQGKAIDAEAGALRGEDAIYRALIWNDAAFEVELAEVVREDIISSSMPMVLVEAMRRVDDWLRLAQELPPLTTVLVIDHSRLLERLRSIPDEVHALMRLFDGQHSIAQVVDESALDDVSSLALVSRLCRERVLVPHAPLVPLAPHASPAPLATQSVPPAPSPPASVVYRSDALVVPAAAASGPASSRALLARKAVSATELLKWWPTR